MNLEFWGEGDKTPSGYGLESLKKNLCAFQGRPGAFEGWGMKNSTPSSDSVSEQLSGWIALFWFGVL